MKLATNEVSGQEYRTRAIISRGLYIFYPISKDHIFVFQEIFQKILSLCMAYIQERLMMARVRYLAVKPYISHKNLFQ